MTRRSQKGFTPSGFTLVELAIALMVIGLLIGGVLKGQELIENARLTRAVQDITSYRTAAKIFENTYDALPGDLRNPASRVPDCSASPCNQTGNGDYYIQLGVIYPWWQLGARSSYTSPEWRNFWVHLVKARLLKDGMDTTIAWNTSSDLAHPQIALQDNYIDVGTMTPTGMPQANYLFVGGWHSTAGLTSNAAESIDIKMDDGLPASGDVLVMSDSNSATLSTNCSAMESGKRVYVNPLPNQRFCNLAITLE